jgi:hypothetical protein
MLIGWQIDLSLRSSLVDEDAPSPTDPIIASAGDVVAGQVC